MIFQKPLLPYLLMIGLTIAVSCAPIKSTTLEAIKIAVIADIHLSNVYGQLKDNDYMGLKNVENGKYAHIRTMESQLHSTRIFNENYFAFLSAMDNVVDRNIKYVILPGDFSDDGQPIHIRALKEILDHYTTTYGIKFFLITGNHDVVQPFNRRDGKTDFLGADGKAQPIMSQPGMYTSKQNKEHPVVISSDLQNLGYEEITRFLGDYGFFPKKEYLYWGTPFSEYNYENYSFHKAEQTADLTKRSHSIPPYGLPIPDISYLVEPVEGLWLLALDANTYTQKEKQGGDPSRQEYPNTGLGLNNLLKDKKYLLDWVCKVADNAKKMGKTLIAFSHYPMVEFNDGASPEMEELLVGSKMQLKRVPDKRVAQLFAQAGLKLHLGGHMHLNDTGVAVSDEGNTLFNIQTPSLAAYKPAFKILTLKEGGFAEVETIVMDSVPKYKEFFGLYHQEYTFLEHMKEGRIWNKEVLSSQNYGEFMEWHLKELVRLRFLPDEWPADFKDFLVGLSGKELLLLSMDNTSLPLHMVLKNLRDNPDKIKELSNSVKEKTRKIQAVTTHFEEWSGYDLLLDLYRLRSADRLALKDIGAQRTKQYRLIIDSILNNPSFQGKDDPIKRKMYLLASIFNKFLNGAPSDHFQLNLNSGTIISLKQPIYENE
ncbi:MULTISPECIES: metallophosphoesterase [unclassified Arenibacter]|uniref:metallophosphoesterase family protein n=1 Tax=unclassified Arenibacter TaxID=2615047 RepID=UPI000E3556D6|nr:MULTISPECIES: metallophosphoesterase [unclassified Arenibacter]MCM4162510.1 metallophosphatase [Arenibacter sp. A80]RFT58093.1 metallophosphoesterase [Arenibacter sp. P308M17]